MLRKIISNGFKKAGYKISRINHEKKKKSITDFRNPQEVWVSPLEGFYKSKTPLFITYVPDDMLMHSRLLEVWVQALKKLDPDRLDSVDSQGQVKAVLENYFESFQPKNAAERLGIQASKPWHYKHPLILVKPWSRRTPEETLIFYKKTILKETQAHGFKDYSFDDGFNWFGPASEKIVEYQLGRLVKIYRSIQKRGLVDELGMITGQVFTYGDNILVRPFHGWHRVAACISLGYKKIPVRFKKGRMLVQRKDYRYWPNVRADFFGEDEALLIFDRMFKPMNHEMSDP